MSQIASPVADISAGNWTPVPVYAEIDAPTVNDNTWVSSQGNPQGDSFEVDFPLMADPGPGPQTLYVRCRRTVPGSGNLPVIITLLQATTVIGIWIVQPTTSFITYAIVLTDSQIDAISNYQTLRLRVTAGRALVTACAQLATVAYYYQFTPSGIGNANCSECGNLNVPTVLAWVLGCFWQSAQLNYCLPPHLAPWTFFYAGNGQWQLAFQTGLAVYQVTNPTWDGLSNLTLTRVTPSNSGPDSAGSCQNYPATITISQV